MITVFEYQFGSWVKAWTAENMDDVIVKILEDTSNSGYITPDLFNQEILDLYAEDLHSIEFFDSENPSDLEQWGHSHECDERIVEAIFYVAQGDAARAEVLWSNPGEDFLGIWEKATKNGNLEGHEMSWNGIETLGDIYDSYEV